MAVKGLSNTQRTLRELRAQGRIAAIAERWNPYAGPERIDPATRTWRRTGIRQDLFGFIDVLALDPQRGIIAIQSCAGSAHAKHRRKIVEECAEAAHEWLRCGGRIELWSWSKRVVVRGGKAMRWVVRVEEIGPEAWMNDEGPTAHEFGGV